MILKGFLMSVNAGAEAEYGRRHRPIWRELEVVLKTHGVWRYSLFLHPETCQLSGYAEIEGEARRAAIARTPECQRWWRYMGKVMPAKPDDSPVVTDLKEILHLDCAARTGSSCRKLHAP